MEKQRKFRLVDEYGYEYFIQGNIYDGSFKGHYLDSVSILVHKFPNDWQEVFEEEPTLESVTDQIKELAKKQGMKCDVVLEKKKEVIVDHFEVRQTGYLLLSEVSFSINQDPVKIEDKESEIIQAIKNILENN